MKKLNITATIIATIIISLNIYSPNAYSQNQRQAKLKPQHYGLIGSWTHLESYCSDWTDQKRQDASSIRREYFYAEHLFINKWDYKIIRTSIKEADINKPPPYEFCYESNLFEPASINSAVRIKSVEKQKHNCSVNPGSFLEDESSFQLKITKNNPKNLIQIFFNNKNCPNGNYIKFYKYKGQ